MVSKNSGGGGGGNGSANNSFYGATSCAAAPLGTTPFVAGSGLNKANNNRRHSSPFELAKCVKSSEVDIKEKPFYDQVR